MTTSLAPVSNITNMRPDVLIVGGGLHGLSAALHLCRAGVKPLVLEKDYPGRHASGVNAGGVRRLGRHFAELPLSIEALELWYAMPDLVDDDCGFTPCGQVLIAETGDELSELKTRVRDLAKQGFTHEKIVDGEQLRSIVPAVSGHCAGGIWCAEDGAANPYRTVSAFHRKVRALGGDVEAESEVTAIRRAHNGWRVDTARGRFEAPVLINTAGAWGNRIAHMIGDFAPVQPEAPMLMITERVEPFLKPVVGSAGRVLSFKQFDNGTVLIGGGHRGRALADSNITQLDFTGLRTSAQTVGALFPQLKDVRVMRAWAGIEGVMPDAIPVIGPSAAEDNTFHAFGFSAHGFQLGPIVGKLLAELVTSGSSSLPIDAFRITRFNDPHIPLP